jgi:hypothetical protein
MWLETLYHLRTKLKHQKAGDLLEGVNILLRDPKEPGMESGED